MRKYIWGGTTNTARITTSLFLLWSVSLNAETDGSKLAKYAAGNIMCTTASVLCGGIVGGSGAFLTGGSGVVPSIAAGTIAASMCRIACDIAVMKLFDTYDSSKQAHVRNQLKDLTNLKINELASLDFQLESSPNRLSNQMMASMPSDVIKKVEETKRILNGGTTSDYKPILPKELSKKIEDLSYTLNIYNYTLLSNEERDQYFEEKYESLYALQKNIEEDLASAVRAVELDEDIGVGLDKMAKMSKNATVTVEFAQNIFFLFGDIESAKIAADLTQHIDHANNIVNAAVALSTSATPLQYMQAANDIASVFGAGKSKPNPEFEAMMGKLAKMDAKLDKLIEGQKNISNGILALGKAIEQVSENVENRFQLINVQLNAINQGVSDVFKSEYYACRNEINNAFLDKGAKDTVWWNIEDIKTLKKNVVDKSMRSCKTSFSKSYRDLAANIGPAMFFFDMSNFNSSADGTQSCSINNIECASFRKSRYVANEKLLSLALAFHGQNEEAVFDMLLSDGFFNKENETSSYLFVKEIKSALLNKAYLTNFKKPVNHLTALESLEDFALFGQVTYLECKTWLLWERCDYSAEYESTLKRALQLANILVAQLNVIEGEVGTKVLLTEFNDPEGNNVEWISDALLHNNYLASNLIRNINYNVVEEYNALPSAQVSYSLSVSASPNIRRVEQVKSWFGRHLPNNLNLSINNNKWFFKIAKNIDIESEQIKSNFAEDSFDSKSFVYIPLTKRIDERNNEVRISPYHLKAKYLRDKLIRQLNELTER